MTRAIRSILTIALCYLAAFHGGWWLFTALILITATFELKAWSQR